MISLLLIILSAFFSAVIDTLQHHFNVSVFKNFQRQFWDPSISWYNKYENGIYANGRKVWFSVIGIKIYFPVQISDAWHFFKTLMLFSFFGSIVLYIPLTFPVMDFAIYGCTYNLIFSLFYNKILR